tara:strand:- start:4118 stop:4399 length:282 start_codon:yes stop_codon:yes gene_type:complete
LASVFRITQELAETDYLSRDSATLPRDQTNNFCSRGVTPSYSFWVWHRRNFKFLKENSPDFDQAITALIEDLHQRGRAEDTTVNIGASLDVRR